MIVSQVLNAQQASLEMTELLKTDVVGGLRGWLFGADGVGPALFGWVAMMLFLYYVAVRYRSQRIHDARSTP